MQNFAYFQANVTHGAISLVFVINHPLSASPICYTIHSILPVPEFREPNSTSVRFWSSSVHRTFYSRQF